MPLTTISGYLGALLLAACALPLLFQTVRDGHARGVNGWFLFLWLTGECSMMTHVVLIHGSAPLILNYAANVAMVGVVGWYRWALHSKI